MSTARIHLTPAELAEIEKEVRQLKFDLQEVKSIIGHFAVTIPINFEVAPNGILSDGDIVDTAFQNGGVTFKSYSGGHAYARSPLLVRPTPDVTLSRTLRRLRLPSGRTARWASRPAVV